MPESPEEKEALDKLDQATRDVAWQEEQKEADREFSTQPILLNPNNALGWFFGRLRFFRRKKGDPVLEPVDDPDPGSEQGLRHTLDDDEKS